MSRSKPQENGTPNPAIRWFEWNGEAGVVRYYDKEKKKNVEIGTDFRFILLDQLGSVRGWHEPSQSGIYSNEVKDTRQSILSVRAFKGGPLVEGLYKDIKDRVHTLGGQFVANCYIAFKHGDGLAIGSMRFKGASLSAWMEFCKLHRADLYEKAVHVCGFAEGKKGRIVFRVPVLKLIELSEDSNQKACALDETLQKWLDGYLQRNTRDQAEQQRAVPPDEDDLTTYGDQPPPLTDDDIPFAWLLPLVLPVLGSLSLFA